MCVCLQDRTHNFLVDLRNPVAFCLHVWVVTLCDQLKTNGPYRGHPRNLVFNVFNSEFSPEVCDLLKRKGSSSQPSIFSMWNFTGSWWKNPAPLTCYLWNAVKKRDILHINWLHCLPFLMTSTFSCCCCPPNPSRWTTPFHPPPKKGKGTLNAGSTNLFINAEPEGKGNKQIKQRNLTSEKDFTQESYFRHLQAKDWYLQKITPWCKDTKVSA